MGRSPLATTAPAAATAASPTPAAAARAVSINAGAGAGQTRTVASNTANTLTVSPAWNLIPDGTSQYVIAIGITVPSLATGQANSTVSRLAGAFTFGTNTGIWDGARCDQ